MALVAMLCLLTSKLAVISAIRDSDGVDHLDVRHGASGDYICLCKDPTSSTGKCAKVEGQWSVTELSPTYTMAEWIGPGRTGALDVRTMFGCSACEGMTIEQKRSSAKGCTPYKPSGFKCLCKPQTLSDVWNERPQDAACINVTNGWKYQRGGVWQSNADWDAIHEQRASSWSMAKVGAFFKSAPQYTPCRRCRGLMIKDDDIWKSSCKPAGASIDEQPGEEEDLVGDTAETAESDVAEVMIPDLVRANTGLRNAWKTAGAGVLKQLQVEETPEKVNNGMVAAFTKCSSLSKQVTLVDGIQKAPRDECCFMECDATKIADNLKLRQQCVHNCMLAPEPVPPN